MNISSVSKSKVSTSMKIELSQIIPPLLPESHKGVCGRIGIVGGSKIYTGAPYYTAISALRVGCDLAHVICFQEAAPVIKSYSPELIVHPILDSPNFKNEISEFLQQLHSLVIGPGLGRDKVAFNATHQLIELAKKKDIPIVLDADALFHLKTSYQDIVGYNKAILTPNEIEFKRLYEAVLAKELTKDASKSEVEELAQVLGNVTIARKGQIDIITNGQSTLLCEEPGSYRRCGGQGDLLSGALGVFSYWAYKMQKSNCVTVYPSTLLAAFAACMLTKRCNMLAFEKLQRSMLVTDMITEIHMAFTSLFGK